MGRIAFTLCVESGMSITKCHRELGSTVLWGTRRGAARQYLSNETGRAVLAQWAMGNGDGEGELCPFGGLFIENRPLCPTAQRLYMLRGSYIQICSDGRARMPGDPAVGTWNDQLSHEHPLVPSHQASSIVGLSTDMKERRLSRGGL